MRFLRTFLAFITFGCALPCAHASSPALPPSIQELTLSEVSAAQLISLTPESKGDALLAITWEDAQSSTLSFALVKQSNHTAQVLWLMQRKDAYEPLLRKITNWKYNQHPVIALTYSQGAMARQLEIFGFTKEGVQLLDQKLGEAIEWKIDRDDRLMAVVYTKPKARLEPTCFGWSQKTGKLAPNHCTP